MLLPPEGEDRIRFLYIWGWMLFPMIILGGFTAYLAHSILLFLFIASLSYPLAWAGYRLLQASGEGPINLLTGQKKYVKPYTDSLQYDADMQKAGALRREGKREEATDLYRLITLKAPKRPEPLLELADTYRDLEDWEQARAAYFNLSISFEKHLGSDHYLIREAKNRGGEMIRKMKETRARKSE